jgi:hypothetical protein
MVLGQRRRKVVLAFVTVLPERIQPFSSNALRASGCPACGRNSLMPVDQVVSGQPDD